MCVAWDVGLQTLWTLGAWGDLRWVVNGLALFWGLYMGMLESSFTTNMPDV